MNVNHLTSADWRFCIYNVQVPSQIPVNSVDQFDDWTLSIYLNLHKNCLYYRKLSSIGMQFVPIAVSFRTFFHIIVFCASDEHSRYRNHISWIMIADVVGYGLCWLLLRFPNNGSGWCEWCEWFKYTLCIRKCYVICNVWMCSQLNPSNRRWFEFWIDYNFEYIRRYSIFKLVIINLIIIVIFCFCLFLLRTTKSIDSELWTKQLK